MFIKLQPFLAMLLSLAMLTLTLPAKAKEDKCALLNEASCLASPSCTLNYISNNKYSCDLAKNSCEQDFTQWTLFAKKGTIQNDPTLTNYEQINYEQVKSCEIKKNCKYKNVNGYCEPGYTCTVTGGTPAMCEKMLDKNLFINKVLKKNKLKKKDLKKKD